RRLARAERRGQSQLSSSAQVGSGDARAVGFRPSWSGTEYDFQGLPATLPAGKTAFQFTDNGAEIHELMVARVKGKDSAKKRRGLSEKELRKKAEEVGITFAQQGQTA